MAFTASELAAVTAKFSDDVNILFTASGCCKLAAECELSVNMTGEQLLTVSVGTDTIALVDNDDATVEQLSAFDCSNTWLSVEVDVTYDRLLLLPAITHEVLFCMFVTFGTGGAQLTVTTLSGAEFTQLVADEACSGATHDETVLGNNETDTTVVLAVDGTVV